MSTALKSYKPEAAPITHKVNERQVLNSTGGYVYESSDVKRLERFLILGVDGGTYYAGQSAHMNSNVLFLEEMLAKDPAGYIAIVTDVSVNARASKNSPAIFALAYALSSVSDEYKASVRAAVQQVCRTSTHLFEFAEYVENLGGWGRAKRGAVASWYASQTPDDLAYQAVKYRQRNGWTHKDLLRLSHPVLPAEYEGSVNFILGKPSTNDPRVIEGFKKVQAATSAAQAVQVVTEYRLPWETVPTEFLKNAALWQALFDNKIIGHTALIRNLKRMNDLGIFNDLIFADRVAKFLVDPEQVKKGRLHPIAFLNALNFSGTSGSIRQALMDGFYVAFGNVEPSNARTMIGLDVSGSMTWGEISGLKGMTPWQAAAAMATVTARTEPYVFIGGFSNTFVPLKVNKNADMKQMEQAMNGLSFGNTRTASAIEYALANKIEIDHFIIYTDNEINYGPHPSQALANYRRKTGINAKLTTVGLTATRFTVADPNDLGMLDVVGFDTSAPNVIANFARV